MGQCPGQSRLSRQQVRPWPTETASVRKLPATVPAPPARAFLAHPTRFERVTFAFRALPYPISEPRKAVADTRPIGYRTPTTDPYLNRLRRPPDHPRAMRDRAKERAEIACKDAFFAHTAIIGAIDVGQRHADRRKEDIWPAFCSPAGWRNHIF